jgi:hypothetical protein
MRKLKRLSKVKLVKEMSRERVPVPATRKIENKKKKFLRYLETHWQEDELGV